MTLTRSLPTQHASGLPLIDERRITAGRFARNADGTARVGVLPAHTNPLVTGRASMGYDVAAFNAVTARTSAGAEEIANDGSVTVATTAAPGANSRIDVIWVRSQFQVLGDANNDVVFGVTQGTAAVSPTKPSIPAGALELATATIPSTATTTLSSGVVITQTHPYTAAAGGVVIFKTKTDIDAWAAAEGSRALASDTNLLWVRRGSAWFAAPGQRLAYMTSNASQGVIDNFIGGLATTPVLPVGQRLRVHCSRVPGSAAAAGVIQYSLVMRNSATDVTPSAPDKQVFTSAYQGGGSLVIAIPGTESEFVTTVAEKVTAGIVLRAGTWTSFGAYGVELWIESA